jgi:hypothetical protein
MPRATTGSSYWKLARSLARRQIDLSRRQALFGRLSIPSDSLPEVFWDTQFILIHDAEIGLRQGDALFCGFSVLVDCCGKVISFLISTPKLKNYPAVIWKSPDCGFTPGPPDVRLSFQREHQRPCVSDQSQRPRRYRRLTPLAPCRGILCSRGRNDPAAKHR